MGPPKTWLIERTRETQINNRYCENFLHLTQRIVFDLQQVSATTVIRANQWRASSIQNPIAVGASMCLRYNILFSVGSVSCDYVAD